MVTRRVKTNLQQLVFMAGAIAALALAASPAAAINVRLRVVDSLGGGCVNTTTGTLTVAIDVSDFPLDPDGEGDDDGGISEAQFVVQFPGCLDFVGGSKTIAEFEELLPARAEGDRVLWAMAAAFPYPPNPIPSTQWVEFGRLTFKPKANVCCSNVGLGFVDLPPLVTKFLDPPDNGSNPVPIVTRQGTGNIINIDTVPPSATPPPPPAFVDLVGETCSGVLPDLRGTLNLAGCNASGGFTITQTPAPGTPVPFQNPSACEQNQDVSFTVSDNCNNSVTVGTTVTFRRKSPPKITWPDEFPAPNDARAIKVVVDAGCKMRVPDFCAGEEGLTITPCTTVGSCSQSLPGGFGMRAGSRWLTDTADPPNDLVLNQCDFTINVTVTAADACPGAVPKTVVVPVTFVANPTVTFLPDAAPEMLSLEWPVRVTPVPPVPGVVLDLNCALEWADYKLNERFFSIGGANCTAMTTTNNVHVQPLLFVNNNWVNDNSPTVLKPNGTAVVPGDSAFTRRVRFTVDGCGEFPGWTFEKTVTFIDRLPPQPPDRTGDNVSDPVPDYDPITVGPLCNPPVPNLCADAGLVDCSCTGFDCTDECTQLVTDASTHLPIEGPITIEDGCSRLIQIEAIACDLEGNCTQVVRFVTYTSFAGDPDVQGLPAGPRVDGDAKTGWDIDKNADCQSVRPNLCDLIDFGFDCIDDWSCSQNRTVGQVVGSADELITVTVTNGCCTCQGDCSNCKTSREYRVRYLDKSAPVLTGVPSSFTQYPEPGQNSTRVQLGDIRAEDNCRTDSLTVTITGGDGGVNLNWPDANGTEPDNDDDTLTWNSGSSPVLLCSTLPYTVTVETKDNAAPQNVNPQTFQITVPCKNLLQLQLQSSALPIARDVSRCVEVRLCGPGAARHGINEVMTFFAKQNRAWGDVFLETDRYYEIPIVDYANVAARSRFHTITRALTPSKPVLKNGTFGAVEIAKLTGVGAMDLGQYDPPAAVNIHSTKVLLASFLGGNAVLLGNVDGRDGVHQDFIDISDYARLVIQAQNSAAICSLAPPLQCTRTPDIHEADGCTLTGNRCFNADFDGDGVVGLHDFTMLKLNILKAGNPLCSPMNCPAPSPQAEGLESAGPVSSMSVKELKAMGIEQAELADVNGDGVVDLTDVELYGTARPKTPSISGKPRPTRLRR